MHPDPDAAPRDAGGSPADRASTLRSALDPVDVATPGSGRTAERHAALADLARHRPLWVARLAEAHLDAVAILDEAGLDPVPGALYGVFASRGDVRAGDVGAGGDGAGGDGDGGDGDGVRLTGTKPFCSGLGIVDRALLTATGTGAHDGLLVDVDVSEGGGATHDRSGWGTPALAASATGSLRLDDRPADRVVGDDGWYLARPGFWHGACGPAACWAGGALGLVDVAEALTDDDPHRRAHLGGLRAAAWALTAVLEQAGREIDAEPGDVAAARRRGLAVRHVVERLATEVIDRLSRSLGPRPLVGDADVAQRVADLHLYLRQSHAERDLAALGDAGS